MGVCVGGFGVGRRGTLEATRRGERRDADASSERDDATRRMLITLIDDTGGNNNDVRRWGENEGASLLRGSQDFGLLEGRAGRTTIALGRPAVVKLFSHLSHVFGTFSTFSGEGESAL